MPNSPPMTPDQKLEALEQAAYDHARRASEVHNDEPATARRSFIAGAEWASSHAPTAPGEPPCAECGGLGLLPQCSKCCQLRLFEFYNGNAEDDYYRAADADKVIVALREQLARTPGLRCYAALRCLLAAYERYVRSQCQTPQQLSQEPWRCMEYEQAERAIKDTERALAALPASAAEGEVK